MSDAGARASAALLEHKGEIARAATAALYARLPALQARYGDRGRAKCLQDMHYHLEHLAPAVDMGDPGGFARYARWCDGVLRARGIPTGDLAHSLDVMEGALASVLAPDEAEAAARCLRAGVDALGGVPA